MTMMSIGIIGAGNISATHVRAIEGIRAAAVVAVYGRQLERARKLAATVGAAPSDTLESFFASAEMDMVAIGTPSGLHSEHGAAAASFGLHVLVEKPLEITTARADRLIAAAAASGVTLGVIFQDRLKPAVRELKALVDGAALGTSIVASARVPWYRPPEYYRDSDWRGTRALDGGGALINQAIHTVDLLLWLCGPVSRVFGRTATRFHTIDVEDTAVAAIEFASGAIGTIEATTAAWPGRPRRIDITGSTGTAILEGDDLIAVDLRGDGGRRSDLVTAAARAENAGSPVVSDAGPHRAVFEDFIRAVSRGEPPCCDGREGRRSVELVEAIYRSARTGQPVELS
jgi:UDP-N-acetyl-2-amino-2-deoxyglucuronate dehydrogenase